MRYNTQRKKLRFMDYGHSVEGLIQYAKTIEDREERNQAALTIVDMMSRVVPRSRENAGWKRRMWDHMMVLADWELDVDWPVWAGKKPETKPEEAMMFKPRRLQYKNKRMKYRHYGRIVEDMINYAKDMPDSPDRDELVGQLIETMKNNFSNWNYSSVSPDVVYNHLYEMSDGVLDYRNRRPSTQDAAEMPDNPANNVEQKEEITENNE